MADEEFVEGAEEFAAEESGAGYGGAEFVPEPVHKPKPDVYSVLLILAFVAFLVGIIIAGLLLVIGEQTLAPEQLYEGRDLALTTDFRDVFAEVAMRHLGTTDLQPIFPGFNPHPANLLGFIRA